MSFDFIVRKHLQQAWEHIWPSKISSAADNVQIIKEQAILPSIHIENVLISYWYKQNR